MFDQTPHTHRHAHTHPIYIREIFEFKKLLTLALIVAVTHIYSHVVDAHSSLKKT